MYLLLFFMEGMQRNLYRILTLHLKEKFISGFYEHILRAMKLHYTLYTIFYDPAKYLETINSKYLADRYSALLL